MLADYLYIVGILAMCAVVLAVIVVRKFGE